MERLHEILSSMQPNQRRIATKRWHKIVGELRSMVTAIPGARGLFSTLQEAFRHQEDQRPRLRLHRHVHDFSEDFRWLAASLSTRPTRTAELVPALTPHATGACDAAATGMGGVHFVPTTDKILPVLWRQPFTKVVQKQLVSFDNPTGTISNSDLELAGSVAHADVLAQFADIRELTVQQLCDNAPAVCWQRKGSTTTTGPAACLLCIQAIHQRHFRCVAKHDYIPGPANVMADQCSRAWHLSDDELLTHFNLQFPQAKPWQLCHVRKPLNSSLIAALFRKRSDPALILNTPTPSTTIGTAGLHSVLRMASTRSSGATKILSQCSNCSRKDTVMAESRPAKGPSDLGQWRTRFVPWVRSSPAWGPKMSERMSEERSISESSGNCDTANDKIRHHREQSQSPSH